MSHTAESWRATFAADCLRIHDEADGPPVAGLVLIGAALFWSGVACAWVL